MITTENSHGGSILSYVFFIFILGVLLCYSCFVSVYLSFFKHGHFDVLTIFFVLTLISLSIIFFYQIYPIVSTTKGLFRSCKKTTIFLPLIVVATFLVAFFHVYSQYSRGPHIAELGQFSMSQSENIIKSAWWQQQVPLDYYFSGFSHVLFEKEMFAIRFHTMLFYLILSLALPLGVWFFTSSLWITSVGSLLFLSNHIFTLHSVDGRPLSLSLLTGFLFLFFYLSCFKNEEKKLSGIALSSLFISQYLFAMSIGLQPVLFIMSLFTSSFFLIKKKKEIFKRLFLTHFGIAILVLPFYIKIIDFGNDARQFSTLTLDKLTSYIINFKTLDIIETFFFPFYGQLKYFFLALVLGYFITMFIKRKKQDATIILLTASIIFIFLIDVIFTTLMNWHLNHWYFIVLGLLLIFFASLALKDISQYLKNKKQRTILALSVSILFSWNLYDQFLYMKNKSRFWYPYRDNSIEKIFDYIGEKGTPRDFLVQLSFTQLPIARTVSFDQMIKSLFHNQNRDPKIIESYIPITDSPPFFYERTMEIIPFINWKKDSKEGKQKIFFATQHYADEDKALMVLSGLMKGVQIGRFSIFEWTLEGKKKEEQYKSFLVKLMKKTPHKYRTALLETLLYYACKNNDSKVFNLLLADYKQLESHLDEITEGAIKLPPKFSLRRRGNFFKDRTYCVD